MKNRPITFLLGVLTVTVATSIPPAGLGQDVQPGPLTAAAQDDPTRAALAPEPRIVLGAEAAAQGPVQPAPQAPLPAASAYRPAAAYGGVSIGPGAAYAAAPCRAYRRAPVAAYGGVYLAPRYVYAGYLAPWGSLPARFYAASIPLPVRAVEPAGYSEPPSGSVARAYEAPYPAPAQPSTPFATESIPEPPRAAFTEPLSSDPEAIPAPSPMDFRVGGLINKPNIQPSTKAADPQQKKPTPRGGASKPSDSGPREF
jgi:hypothetical protein